MNEIKELMELGILIEPDALDALNKLSKKDMSKVFLSAKEERPLMLSKELVKKYLSNIELRVVRKMQPRDKITISDLTNSLNEKYNLLKDALLRKIEIQNAVSINKLSSGDVTIIGMVKEIEQKEDRQLIEAEDLTGSIKCIVPKEVAKLSEDDVVSLSGRINNKILFVNQINFPDVPIRNPNYSGADIKVAFITNYNEKMIIEADIIVIMKCENIDRVKEKYKGKLVYSLKEITAPSIVEINGVNIMFLIDQDPLSTLKKRYISANNADFIIDVVPDIVFVNKKMNANYKSISILGDNVIINLKDREIKEINT